MSGETDADEGRRALEQWLEDEESRRGAHAEAAEILADGAKAEACEVHEIAHGFGEGAPLTAQWHAMSEQPSHPLTMNCPDGRLEASMDKIGALTLGASLLIGYGASRISQAFEKQGKE